MRRLLPPPPPQPIQLLSPADGLSLLLNRSVSLPSRQLSLLLIRSGGADSSPSQRGQLLLHRSVCANSS
ncbi:hypothetical protein PR202_gb09072 [Eleusine coracana subsp. coracana]|uniref:Uncharacterized protein n=1 Tax=Eleusine coracana subsp. coracana TaxID=191504 RepID=A0AAV5EGN0_ELECO|nr:hypothetical protein PR202_gb09072 [Eleusine coracana subsp. coracana]